MLTIEIVLLMALSVLAGTGVLRYQADSKLVMIGILFWPTETAPPDEASLDSAMRSQRAPTGVHITSVWVRKCCYGGGHARGWVVSLDVS